MASATAAVTMAMQTPAAMANQKSLFNPMRVASSPRVALKAGRLEVRASAASNREKAVAGLTAAAMAAALVLPGIAEAAQPGLSPSLKNFLLSIVSGGVVLTGIIGVVVGVSNFDPVKRT